MNADFVGMITGNVKVILLIAGFLALGGLLMGVAVAQLGVEKVLSMLREDGGSELTEKQSARKRDAFIARIQRQEDADFRRRDRLARREFFGED